jgi:hypothetical protein
MHLELQLFCIERERERERERELRHPECFSSKILGHFKHEICLDYLHFFLFSLALQPSAGYGLLFHEVS